MTSIYERTREAELGPHPFRWTVTDYYEMAELGKFENRRVELIEGEIVEMSPMLAPHATAVALTQDELKRVFGVGYAVRGQSSFSLSDDSEPEPDVLVAPGSLRDYKHKHPSTAVLVVEISDSTLRYDRTIKASLYARSGVPEYWILNLQDRQLETFRAPIQDEDARFGWRYGETNILGENEAVSPLEAPTQALTIADMLP